jgi:hypothetical protein
MPNSLLMDSGLRTHRTNPEDLKSTPRFNGAAGGKRQLSAAGGVQPRWRRDGKVLFYVNPGGELISVELSIRGPTLEIGRSHELFGPLLTGNGYQYDVSADGQRLLAVLPSQQESVEPLALVQNWQAELKK